MNVMTSPLEHCSCYNATFFNIKTQFYHKAYLWILYYFHNEQGSIAYKRLTLCSLKWRRAVFSLMQELYFKHGYEVFHASAE
jgi:hypothetical protein